MRLFSPVIKSRGFIATLRCHVARRRPVLLVALPPAAAHHCSSSTRSISGARGGGDWHRASWRHGRVRAPGLHWRDRAGDRVRVSFRAVVWGAAVPRTPIDDPQGRRFLPVFQAGLYLALAVAGFSTQLEAAAGGVRDPDADASLGLFIFRHCRTAQRLRCATIADGRSPAGGDRHGRAHVAQPRTEALAVAAAAPVVTVASANRCCAPLRTAVWHADRRTPLHPFAVMTQKWRHRPRPLPAAGHRSTSGAGLTRRRARREQNWIVPRASVGRSHGVPARGTSAFRGPPAQCGDGLCILALPHFASGDHIHVAQTRGAAYLLALWYCLERATPRGVSGSHHGRCNAVQLYGALIAAVITPFAVGGHWWMHRRSYTARPAHHSCDLGAAPRVPPCTSCLPPSRIAEQPAGLAYHEPTCFVTARVVGLPGASVEHPLFGTTARRIWRRPASATACSSSRSRSVRESRRWDARRRVDGARDPSRSARNFRCLRSSRGRVCVLVVAGAR